MRRKNDWSSISEQCKLEEDGEESLARRLLGESEDGTRFLPCLALAVPGCYAAI